MWFRSRAHQAAVMRNYPQMAHGNPSHGVSEEDVRERSFGEETSAPRYGAVADAEGIARVNRMIRQAIPLARNQEELTKLYRQSLYLVTLSKSPNWRDIRSAERTAARQFSLTARKINRAATRMGAEVSYDVEYGE